MKKNTHPYHQEALARANLYDFVSLVYLRPPSKGLFERMRRKDFLEELGVLFGDRAVAQWEELGEPDSDQILRTLHQEYMELFVVPTDRYVTPFEDVYHGETLQGGEPRGPLLGERAIAVSRIYRAAGAQLDESCRELPTHIGVELSFMSFLCRREAQAFREERSLDKEKGTSPRSLPFRQLQRRFLQEHLNEWFPSLSRSIQRNARSLFYRGFALATEEFLAFDAAWLTKEIP